MSLLIWNVFCMFSQCLLPSSNSRLHSLYFWSTFYTQYSCQNSYLLVFPSKRNRFSIQRALATTMLVGASIIGSGLGFAIPTLSIDEDSLGEFAQREVFYLYLGYGLATVVLLVLNIGLLR